MRVLIVGAGNVGVVYAQHLRGAGAEVALFVKPAHEAAARAGVALERLGFGGTTTSRLEGVAAFTAWPDVAAHGPWDWVVLTVPPGALRAPGFVPGVRSALGDAGTALALVLGLGDAAWLDAQLGPGRLALGEIVLISYSAPLDAPKGSTQTCAYFLPPIAKAPLSGPHGPKLDELAKVLSRGGLATAVVPDARRQSRLPAAVLFALVSALKLVGWRFSALGHGDALALCLSAAKEREAVLGAAGAGPGSAMLGVFTPTVMRVALWGAARVLPLPLEAYLRVHFTKVDQQFVEDRARLIESAKALGVPTPNLETLHARLG